MRECVIRYVAARLYPAHASAPALYFFIDLMPHHQILQHSKAHHTRLSPRAPIHFHLTSSYESHC